MIHDHPPPNPHAEGLRPVVWSDGDLGRALFELSPFSSVIYDAEGHPLAVNAAFTDLWGVRMDEVPVEYSVLADAQLDRAGVLPFIRRAFAGETVATPPVRYDMGATTSAPNGRTIWTQGYLYAVCDREGRLRHVVLTHIDLTDRMEHEEQFRTLADSIPQLAWMADASGAVFWYNRRWYDYTGTSLADMQGTGWRRVHHPEHADRVAELFNQAIDRAEPWEDIFPLRARDGTYRWFLSRALPIRDGEGQVERWFGTNTDVTEQREAAAERERLLGAERAARDEAEEARAGAEAAYRAKSDFLAKMSHELRQPLNAIEGYAELLEMGIHGAVSPAQRGALERIRHNQRTLLGAITNILNFAKLETGTVPLDRMPVPIGELFGTVTALVADQFAARDVAFVAVPPGGVRDALGDRERILQICLNLLTNAMKATPAGGSVELSAAPDAGGDAVTIRVRDTGPGIPRDSLETIFTPFTQLGRSLNAPGEGVGLGLPISRELARAMGGELVAESGPVPGATLALSLPAA